MSLHNALVHQGERALPSTLELATDKEEKIPCVAHALGSGDGSFFIVVMRDHVPAIISSTGDTLLPNAQIGIVYKGSWYYHCLIEGDEIYLMYNTLKEQKQISAGHVVGWNLHH